MWEELSDGQDCSVARGIGLAVANNSYLSALQVAIVRPSERFNEETGDNLVFFGSNGASRYPDCGLKRLTFFRWFCVTGDHLIL